ncbi:MAG: GlsB/YeaQ/YmgE family stress response membrane protein [Candidatus Palauibacterales bacterium]|nr:GlsB/YeaQ/YmgE family stress response membrane protein [Candidatus Palauibacterales bacterium]
MDLSSFVLWLVIGGAAGWIAGTLMKGGGFGLFGNIVVGIIGAVLGGWLFAILGVTVGGGILGSLIVATVGAVLLLFVAGLFS